MAVNPKEPESQSRWLLQLGQVANSSLDLAKVFYRAAVEVRKVFACDRLDLVLVNADDGARQGMSLEFGEPPRWKNLAEADLSNSPAASVIDQRRADVKSIGPNVATKSCQRALLDKGLRSYAFLPLVCRSEVIGAFGILSRQVECAGQWDVVLLREAAAVLAPAFDNVRAYQQIRDLKRRLEKENAFLRNELRSASSPTELIGISPALNKVRLAIEQVAPTDSTVLITGETGTGKELIAQAIHQHSRRSKRLLVNVNCAALRCCSTVPRLQIHRLRHGLPGRLFL